MRTAIGKRKEGGGCMMTELVVMIGGMRSNNRGGFISVEGE